MKTTKSFGLTLIIVSLTLLGLVAISPRAASRQQQGQDASRAAEAYRAEKLARLGGEVFVDGTVLNGSRENRFMEESLRNERAMMRWARMQPEATARRKKALNADIGDIAVIEDDGRLVLPENPFDLRDTTVVLTRTADGQYVVDTIDRTYTDFVTDLGTKLGRFRGSQSPADDGFAAVDLDFSFPYFDDSYDRMFVGTNGYITFGRGDSRGRADVTQFLIRPRIAAFWADLDPGRVASSPNSGIFVKQLSDRAVVTYRFIPRFRTSEFNTFQVTLLDSGQIHLSYSRQMRTKSALVGISPGRTARQTVLDLSAPRGGELGDGILEIFRELAAVNIFGVPSVFFETHQDDYDFLYIWTDFRFDLGGAFAFYAGAQNQVQGIGTPIFDRTASFGSSGRLIGILGMNDIVDAYPASPDTRFFGGLNSPLSIMGQEQGHAWLASPSFPGRDPFLLLGRQRAHWSFFFNTESTTAFSSPQEPRSSSVEGNVWIDNGDGTFSSPGNLLVDGYSSLDQYLMGLRLPEEVEDSFVIVDPDVPDPVQTRSVSARRNRSIRGSRLDVSIRDIIEANGPRAPNALESQKAFPAAFILVVQQGATPSQSTLDKLNLFRTEWQAYFNRATDNRAQIITPLSN